MAIAQPAESVLLELVRKTLNEAMIQAAEPIIQKAVKQVEAEMRKQMASSLIAMVDRQVDVRLSGEAITFRFDRSASVFDGTPQKG